MALKQQDIFPNTCKVYKLTEDYDQFSTDEEEFEVIYEGCCRDEANAAMRTYQGTGGVMKLDHALYIPTLLQGVTNECFVDITNYNEEVKGLQISACQPVKYGKREGTTIFYNEPKN